MRCVKGKADTSAQNDHHAINPTRPLMFKHLLLPTDGSELSEAAIRQAVLLVDR